MIETTPEVFLISKPWLVWGVEEGEGIWGYLDAVDGVDWGVRIRRDSSSDGEALTEFGGRLCYRSWKEGLNPNVERVRTDSGEYFQNLLSSKHGSVLEHANYSFVFHNVSRVFTHELVRHRAGVAISQESLRFVRLTDLGFRIPAVLREMGPQIISIVENLEDFQRQAAEQFGLDDEGVPFHYKKEVTSALRRLAPIGLSTGMLWTANIRTLRWTIEARTSEGAEEEIRIVFKQVCQHMKKECPLLFEDFMILENGTCRPEYSKV